MRPGQWLAIAGGAGHLTGYAIALARRAGLRIVADARAEDAARVRERGADVVVARGADFAGAVRRAVPEGVDGLHDTAVLGSAAFGAIRDGGVYLPVRGWADMALPRDIAVRPVFVFQALERTDWLALLGDMVASGDIRLSAIRRFAAVQAADAQRALLAGNARSRAVIVFD